MKDTSLTPVKLLPHPQTRDHVFQKLRRAIITGELKPGQRLVERTLAEQLGVSRTPVREAIRMLELEGLISHLPKLGAVVARVSDAEVLEIYRIRSVLEGLAAHMAAENITPADADKMMQALERIESAAQQRDLTRLEKEHRQFNDIIYRAAGSPRLYGMITTLVDHIQRHVHVGYNQPKRIEEATREHRRLAEAIKARNGPLAEQIAREHIDNSRKAYFFKSPPTGGTKPTP
ncbi:GntR family transcriptional regulator [Desulfallas thermosapovorans]|uniref:DNA-binding GntR family transcriptional regulator n=1 Tax=Desulfallas thermosapovorans DSM 6562 TaxID=1121431 RepID=A0A5S4ZSR3_9FIRM|nr:GntR family transcriptional regulator [Desulfallas thermosapovorans]TYO95979.1 DNA-binding GntR family transcriptional regulator [Desulfallas thermosapovorans DSM 6562]